MYEPKELEKDHLTYKCRPKRITIDFPLETMKARRDWSNILQVVQSPVQTAVLSKTISHSWRRKPCYNKKDLRNLWPLSELYRRHRKEYIVLRRLERPKTVWTTNNSRTLNQRGLIDHHKNNITTGINTHFSKIIINIGDFNIPIKRHRLDWLWKQDPSSCCLQETQLMTNDWHHLIVIWRKKVFQANIAKKQVQLFYYLTNWLQTKTKRKRYGMTLYIHSRKIQWWVIILLHKFAPNIKAPSYLKKHY